MNVYDWIDFSRIYYSNTGEWKLRDKDGNLRDMKIVEKSNNGEIIFEEED